MLTAGGRIDLVCQIVWRKEVREEEGKGTVGRREGAGGGIIKEGEKGVRMGAGRG